MISISTANGMTCPNTATCGTRRPFRSAGRRTATVIGHGSIPGAGHGSTTSRGALRPSITAAGCTRATAGAGCRDRCMRGLCTHPRWWRSSAVRASRCRSGSAAAGRSAGFRWGRAMCTCRGSTRRGDISPTSTSPTSATCTSTRRLSTISTAITARDARPHAAVAITRTAGCRARSPQCPGPYSPARVRCTRRY